MDPSVLNVVLYLYEHYLEDNDARPPRAALENILHSGGVSATKAAQALDWLETLGSGRPVANVPGGSGRRVYNPRECARLNLAARGLLMELEQKGILQPADRELVIERALALDEPRIDVEALQWVVLLTLFHLPDRESAFARMEDICYADSDDKTH
ncbi:MAG: DUF494 domain-containing protein [Gammaproteobacteria bacterium]|nr:DUF494 domain-containing protein [Gammaproteobacteria bacterium]